MVFSSLYPLRRTTGPESTTTRFFSKHGPSPVAKNESFELLEFVARRRRKLSPEPVTRLANFVTVLFQVHENSRFPGVLAVSDMASRLLSFASDGNPNRPTRREHWR